MSDAKAEWVAPSLDDFSALARAALERLPEPFRGLAGEVLIRVEDFPSEEMIDELGLDDAFGLTGLYSGVDLAHRSVLDGAPHQPMVFLYRRPILDEWAENGEITLGALIEHVLIHELGHHFGLSDADMHRIQGPDF